MTPINGLKSNQDLLILPLFGDVVAGYAEKREQIGAGPAIQSIGHFCSLAQAREELLLN
jgi:hypothetical protein